jgi:hypothetical protein
MAAMGSTVLRRPGRVAAAIIPLVIVDVLLIFLLLSAGGLPGALFFGVALVVMVYGTVGTARARVDIGADGVVIRNGWRVRRIPWREVAFISPATDDPAFKSVGVATVGGPRVRCFAVGSLRWENAHSPVQHQMYEALNAHLLAARAAGRAPSSE